MQLAFIIPITFIALANRSHILKKYYILIVHSFEKRILISLNLSLLST